MKFDQNNHKKSVTLLSLLSFCAIATSTAIAAIEPLSKKEASVPTTEQQSEKQEQEKSFEPIVKDQDETWEQVELEKEWEENMIDDESGEEILLASGRTL